MNLRLAGIVVVALVLCYVGAGGPALSILASPSVIGEGLALKAITYHELNPADRLIPEAELLASRFYVLVIAALCLAGGFTAFTLKDKSRSFNLLLSMSIGLLAIFVYAGFKAYYTFG